VLFDWLMTGASLLLFIMSFGMYWTKLNQPAFAVASVGLVVFVWTGSELIRHYQPTLMWPQDWDAVMMLVVPIPAMFFARSRREPHSR
jgi:hypothetical protein